VLHWLRITGVIAELYDVVALSGVVRPDEEVLDAIA
jgi:hypothetical protein